MAFDLAALLEEHRGENFELHTEFMNPQMAKMLKTIGFDRFYVRGEGSVLIDDHGDRYLDLLSGFGVFALGRSHPGIKDALHQALDADLPNLAQLDCALLPGLLAKELVARSHPGIERVVFTNSGAEAVEAAIKFARYATRRSRILYCDHAFHGLTNGALSLNGGKEFRKGFGPLLPGCEPIPFGDADALARELAKGDVAAFVVEPIQGKGVYMATDAYWAAVPELCRRHGTLLVVDEVQTGMGRTGRFFCHQHWGVGARHHHGVQSTLGRLHPGRGHVRARARCSTASTARWTGPSSTRPRSRGTSWPWWPAWPRWRPSTTRGSSSGLRRPGRASWMAWRPWSRSTSSCTRCGAKG